MKGIVEGFEGDFVLIEIDGVIKDIAGTDVESGVRAGDCVELVDGKWVTDEAETESRTKKIKELMNDVWED